MYVRAAGVATLEPVQRRRRAAVLAVRVLRVERRDAGRRLFLPLRPARDAASQVRAQL